MIALILAGGSGTRLWPLSRELYAKQFLNLNSSLSLLQQAVDKAIRHCDEVFIVTNDSQYFLVKHQIEGFNIEDENIIKEPVGKNTAPAIALGCRFIQERYGDKNVLVMPSDHIIDDSFFETAKKAEAYADDYLCTFGIRPAYASTGYGYIKLGRKKGEGYRADGFFEKPQIEEAKEFLSSGDYLWNSGIFLFKIERILSEFKTHLPDLYKHLSTLDELLENYGDLAAISMDYGIMEKADEIMVFPFEGRWSDVGSWESVYAILQKDEEGNTKKGDVVSLDTENSLILGEERLIATIGVRDVILVDTKDALLVASKARAEDVRKIVEKLKDAKRSEVSLHATVYRPWGYYTVLEEGERYKVKRLTIYPKKSISLQMHHHRAEHWIVVKGTARITKEDKVVLVHENESIYVPKSTHHRVENPGKVELHIIEIQTGEYVEEDDIVRFEDKYGRA